MIISRLYIIWINCEEFLTEENDLKSENLKNIELTKIKIPTKYMAIFKIKKNFMNF